MIAPQNQTWQDIDDVMQSVTGFDSQPGSFPRREAVREIAHLPAFGTQERHGVGRKDAARSPAIGDDFVPLRQFSKARLELAYGDIDRAR